MPNHVHGIIVLAGAGIPALSEIVRQVKTFSARRINIIRGTRGRPVWQRNYWEHIVRDESELHCIREYIHHNPACWESDKLYGQPPAPGFQEIREPAVEYGLEAWMV
jgi:REP element-mobilizing transposase RayT